MKDIFLFTLSFPYSLFKEETFIIPEINILKKNFKINLVPLRPLGELIYKSNEIIVRRLQLKVINLLKVFFLSFCYDTFKEAMVCFRHYKLKLRPIKRLLVDIYFMNLVYVNILGLIRNNPKLSNAIYYTYWFSPITSGLLKIKRKYPITVITRAHGYDLYEGLYFNYIPFRRRDVKLIDYIITVSKNGERYLRDKYKINNVKTFYLGINDKKIINPINYSGCLKLLSCSYITKNKRIDFIMSVLNKYSRLSGTKIYWVHIGGGPFLNKFIEKTSEISKDMMEIIFLGNLNNEAIFNIYKNEPFDYFINLSISEGLPVSIIEAISVGLPVIAPDIGGIGEAISDEFNGFLLSSSPDEDEIIKVLYKAQNIKNNIYEFKKLRFNARKTFELYFNASNTHDIFKEFMMKTF